jgi:hypothetical protein
MGVADFWRPTRDQVSAAERAIDSALVRALDSLVARDSVGFAAWRTRPRASWPEQYYRQYAGLTYPDGRRTVYINAMPVGYPEGFSQRAAERPTMRNHPLTKPDWWRRVVPHICDGGEYFWGAEYDPLTSRVLSLQFNGRA